MGCSGDRERRRRAAANPPHQKDAQCRPAANATPAVDGRYGRCLENSRRSAGTSTRTSSGDATSTTPVSSFPTASRMISRLEFLSAADARLLSQIQGRTYTNIFGLAERWINAKVLELSREHWLGDQVALEALVGFSRGGAQASGAVPPPRADDGREHARRLRGDGQRGRGGLAGAGEVHLGGAGLDLPHRAVHPGALPRVDRARRAPSPLFKDVFLFHWKEESQHAILDELEWTRCDRA